MDDVSFETLPAAPTTRSQSSESAAWAEKVHTAFTVGALKAGEYGRLPRPYEKKQSAWSFARDIRSGKKKGFARYGTWDVKVRLVDGAWFVFVRPEGGRS